MPRTWLKTLWRTQRRRLIAVVTLLAHLIATVGYPLPASARAEAGPCGRDSAACCCGTAEQCRASGCGCSHSPALVEEPPTPSCCSKKATKPDARSCCSKPEQPRPEKRSTKSESVRWVLGISAQKCRGGAWAEPGEAPVLAVVAPYCLQITLPFCVLIPTLETSHPMRATDVLDPPPRSEAVV